MSSIVQRLENKLRAGWRSAMREIKDANSVPQLEAAIASSNVTDLIAGIDESIAAFATDVASGYVYAGQRAARAIDADIAGTFRFDLVDDAATAWMQETAEQIAGDLIAEQQAVALRVVRNGTRRGLTPQQIAGEVQGSIGLTPGQVDQVERYREVLETGDYRRAMSYQLADGRYDAALGRALDSGTFFGPERIDAMVGRYRDNWVSSRADGVALETAQEASHAGVDDAFRQAVEQGKVADADVLRTWVTRHDSKVRSSHRVMDGQTRALDEPFISGFGNELMYPGDEDAPAEDTVNCRCKVVTVNLSARKRLTRCAA